MKIEDSGRGHFTTMNSSGLKYRKFALVSDRQQHTDSQIDKCGQQPVNRTPQEWRRLFPPLEFKFLLAFYVTLGCEFDQFMSFVKNSALWHTVDL